MTQLRFEAPLSWPEGLPATLRSSQRTDHGFSAQISLQQAVGYLAEEMQDDRFHAAILSMDIEQPLVDRLRRKVGNRTGACLQLKYNSKTYVIGCDRWLTLEHNVYAISLAIRHWRNMDRWGIGSLAALLSGFEAHVNEVTNTTTTSTSIVPEWMEALGLGPSATLEDAVAVYHRRAKMVADDSQALTKLNLVMHDARAYFAQNSE